jgi:hypothetical protein
MDKCGFSEFTYGYCVTEDLIVGKGTELTAAPVFPSLIEEGQTGKGYDVQLDRPGTPLFLQFKLVHQMVRDNASEAQRGHFTTPFYRIHLRSRALSDQHASLLALEQAGNDVFYVAPGFYTKADLNAAYAKRRVWDRSFRIRPSAIGPLPDDKHHHVTFKTATSNWRFYSEDPSREGTGLNTKEIAASLRSRIAERGRRTLKEQVPELDAMLADIVHSRVGQRDRSNLVEVENREDPLRRVAFMARQFFDCQLFFVSLKP